MKHTISQYANSLTPQTNLAISLPTRIARRVVVLLLRGLQHRVRGIIIAESIYARGVFWGVHHRLILRCFRHSVVCCIDTDVAHIFSWHISRKQIYTWGGFLGVHHRLILRCFRHPVVCCMHTDVAHIFSWLNSRQQKHARG